MKKLTAKKNVIIGLFFVLFYGVGFAQDENMRLMSYDEAIDISKQNSHVLKQMSYLQNEKNQEAQATKGYYLPKVGINATYMLMSDDLHLDLTEVKNSITPIYRALGNYGEFSGVPNPDPNTNQVMPILPDNISTQAVRNNFKDGLAKIEAANWDRTIQKKQFGDVAATFQWPFYVGGKIRAANKASIIESREVTEQTRQKDGELISELTERYFGLCLAQQAYNVRKDVYKGMEKHLDDALKMEKQGLIANAEVLHAKVFHAQSERELNKAKRNIIIINEALINTLAWDTVIDIKPISELFYLDTIETVEYFKSQAMQNNPMLKQVESKKELAMQNKKVQVSEFLPTVALMGMYDIANKDLSPYAPEWLVGVGLKWNLFDGALRIKKIKAASFKTMQVDEFHEKTTSDLSTGIEKLYQELENYNEQLRELETETRFAEEYLRVRDKAFKQEMSNATEVVDARLALAKVYIDRLQAMYGYDITLAKLLQYSGTPEKFNEYRNRKSVKTESYQSINE
jgi:outer membrane protein TolC